MRIIRVATAIVAAALLLTGCVFEPQAPATDPAISAQQSNPAAPDWEPDALVETHFPDENGEPVNCSIRLRVVTVSDTPDAGTQLQLAGAKAFLATTEWNTDVSLDDYPADVLAARRDRGTAQAMLLTMLVDDGMTAAISASGVITPVLQIEGFTSCDSA